MAAIKNITDEGTFNGGYFIINPECKKLDYVKGDNVLVTLPNDLSLKHEIMKLIKQAKTSIKICSFILEDHEIIAEIQSVLEAGNVAVFFITQLDESKFSASFLTEEEIKENRYQNHLDSIERFYSYGAHIRASKSAHAKFIIADRNDAIIMSANLTNRSLNQNPETGIYLTDNDSIRDLDNLFDMIYQEGTSYTKFLKASKNKQFIISREISVNNENLNRLLSNSLRFTFEMDQQSLYKEIINIIHKADKDIWLSTYSIVALDYLPEFIDVIEKFIKKDGKIRIFCRGMNYRSDHLSNCLSLINKGCEIYGDFYNHSKMIVSNSQAMLFTANIDGNHGLKSGFEVGYITDPETSLGLMNHIIWQIATAPFKFINNPSKKDYFNTYSFICKNKNIKVFKPADGWVIKLNGDSKSLLDRIDCEPIYFYMDRDAIIMISVGSEYYRATRIASGLELNEKVPKGSNKFESYLLRYKTLKISID